MYLTLNWNAVESTFNCSELFSMISCTIIWSSGKWFCLSFSPMRSCIHHLLTPTVLQRWTILYWISQKNIEFVDPTIHSNRSLHQTLILWLNNNASRNHMGQISRTASHLCISIPPFNYNCCNPSIHEGVVSWSQPGHPSCFCLRHQGSS